MAQVQSAPITGDQSTRDDTLPGLDERRPSLPGIKDLFRDNPNVLTQNSSPSHTHTNLSTSGVPSVPGESPQLKPSQPQFTAPPSQPDFHSFADSAAPPPPQHHSSTDLFDTYSMSSGRSNRNDSMASTTSNFSSVPDPLDYQERRRSSLTGFPGGGAQNYSPWEPTHPGYSSGPYGAAPPPGATTWEKPRPPSREYALSTERGSISEETAGGDVNMVRPETESSPGGRTFAPAPWQSAPVGASEGYGGPASNPYYYPQRQPYPYQPPPPQSHSPFESENSAYQSTVSVNTPTRSHHQLPPTEDMQMSQQHDAPVHVYQPPQHPPAPPQHHPAYSRPPPFAQLGPPASHYHPPPPASHHQQQPYGDDPWAASRPSSMGGGPGNPMPPPLHSAYMSSAPRGSGNISFAGGQNRPLMRASVPNSHFAPPPVPQGAGGIDVRRASESDAQAYWQETRPGTSGSSGGGGQVEHGRELKHHCPFCQKAFNRPSSLRIHVYSHTGERPYVCQWKGCGRAFSVQSNLKRHNKVHTQGGSQAVPNHGINNNPSSDQDGEGEDGSDDEPSRPSTSMSGVNPSGEAGPSSSASSFRNAASDSPYARSSSFSHPK